MYKDQNLLGFKGSRSDYAGFGRYLARKILTDDELKLICWFPQRKLLDNSRCAASEEDESAFKGFFSNYVLF